MKSPEQYQPRPKAGPPPAKGRQRVRPVSRKRQAQMAERRQVRDAVLARDQGCRGPALGAPGPCRGPLDPHEPRGGSERALTWLDVDLVITLCRSCHDHVHANPAWAYERGLLIRSSTQEDPMNSTEGAGMALDLASLIAVALIVWHLVWLAGQVRCWWHRHQAEVAELARVSGPVRPVRPSVRVIEETGRG